MLLLQVVACYQQGLLCHCATFDNSCFLDPCNLLQPVHWNLFHCFILPEMVLPRNAQSFALVSPRHSTVNENSLNQLILAHLIRCLFCHRWLKTFFSQPNWSKLHQQCQVDVAHYWWELWASSCLWTPCFFFIVLSFFFLLCQSIKNYHGCKHFLLGRTTVKFCVLDDEKIVLFSYPPSVWYIWHEVGYLNYFGKKLNLNSRNNSPTFPVCNFLYCTIKSSVLRYYGHIHVTSDMTPCCTNQPPLWACLLIKPISAAQNLTCKLPTLYQVLQFDSKKRNKFVHLE